MHRSIRTSKKRRLNYRNFETKDSILGQLEYYFPRQNRLLTPNMRSPFALPMNSPTSGLEIWLQWNGGLICGLMRASQFLWEMVKKRFCQFFGGSDFLSKIWYLNYFFEWQASYHFVAYEFINSEYWIFILFYQTISLFL